MSSQSFPKFEELPIELQLKIWHPSFCHPRVIGFRRPGVLEYDPPATLAVNRVSRQEALRFYKIWTGFAPGPRIIYFNPQVDRILLVNGAAFEETLDLFGTNISSVETLHARSPGRIRLLPHVTTTPLLSIHFLWSFCLVRMFPFPSLRQIVMEDQPCDRKHTIATERVRIEVRDKVTAWFRFHCIPPVEARVPQVIVVPPMHAAGTCNGCIEMEEDLAESDD